VANLKSIRKRISSVKSTQKITRAMKMVAGARLNRAQQRITALRPYAVTTGRVLREVVGQAVGETADHPLLALREDKRVLYVVVTSDRGLCAAFNSNINKAAELAWRQAEAEGKEVQLAVIGRKGRDYFRRRNAPIYHVFKDVWDNLGVESARAVARTVLRPFLRGEVDAIYLVYNEFKSAMSQTVVVEPLFPLKVDSAGRDDAANAEGASSVEAGQRSEFIFEPGRTQLLEHLVPTYVEITLLRALYESMASELGARMTAMDSATKNATEMIDRLSLTYNRARQAAITTEILEIIGGAEALKQG
jgi:F-type H+-transporting ATPase subunit gamma